MLVEDEPDFYEVLTYLYQLFEVEVLGFPTAEEAIDWINAVDTGDIKTDLPQFAIIDIRLPGKLTGVNVAARIRQSPQLKHIGIILITAYRLSPKEEKDVMRLSQADKLIYKPLPEIKQFQKLIRDVVKSRV